MGCASFSAVPLGKRRAYTCLLALCWCSGLALGSFLSIYAGNSVSFLMRSAPGGAVSIVSLLWTATFPFLISAAAVYFSRSAIFPVCFIRAFLFAFSAVGISQAMGSPGWPLARLVLFSDCLLLPVEYFLWLRVLSCKEWMPGGAAILVPALVLLIVSVDYRIISPLLAVVIKI